MVKNIFVIRFRNFWRLLHVKHNRREKYLDLKLVSKIALCQNSYLRCFDGPTVTHVVYAILPIKDA
jgi:hypothetical protein